MAEPFAGRGALGDLPVNQHQRAIDDHVRDASGHLCRVRISRPFLNGGRVEDRHIGIHPDLQTSLSLHPGNRPFESLSREQRDLPDALHPVHDLELAHESSKEATERSCAPGVSASVHQPATVGADDSQRTPETHDHLLFEDELGLDT